MNEEVLKDESSKDVVDNSDYINAINKIKENTVDRSLYDKVRADNKRLLDSLVNGTNDKAEEKKNEPVNIQELRNKTFKEGQSNLEFATNALQLRKALIENGERDPFLPYGNKIVPTNEDYEASERVATVLQECVDYAQGDNDAFTNELMRRTVDTSPRRRI